MKKLRWFGRWGLYCVGSSLGTAVLLTMVNGILGSRGSGSALDTLGIYVVLAGTLILFMTSFIVYQTYVPLIISMNGRRKETFWLFQITKIAEVISVTALAMVLFSLGSRIYQIEFSVGDSWKLGAIVFLCLFFFASMGNLGGSLYTRWGKWAKVFLIVFAAAAGGLIGYTSAGGLEGFQRLLDVIQWKSPVMIGFLAAAEGADLLVSWVCYRKMEIRC